jgi:Tfp pilus assembly protein PilF
MPQRTFVTYTSPVNSLVNWLSHRWRETLIILALAALACAVGWGLARRKPAPLADPMIELWTVPGLSAPQQRALDDAFAALKTGHLAAAEQKFADLLKQQRLWTILNSDRACVALAQHNEARFLALVEQGEKDGSLQAADGKLLLALRMTKPGSFSAANQLFAEAAAADPTRSDVFDQWGDCLLRWGKPAEAAKKFRGALLRNPFPGMDDLYGTKFVLAQIQSGQDAATGLGQRLDLALASPEPPSAALFAGAARAMRTNGYAEAAAFLERARRVTAPSIYLVLLLNPAFRGDSWRPELAPLYDEAEKGQADMLHLQGDE